MATCRRHRGFSLIEALFAVAILGMLLASIAAAVRATFESYEENDKIASVTQSARWALAKIMTDIRTADSADATSAQVTLVPPDNPGGLEQIRYAYANGVLTYYRTVHGSTTSYPLLGGEDIALTLFAAQKSMGTDWEGQSCVKSITIRMQFTVDNQTFAMTASASPRRNQIF